MKKLVPAASTPGGDFLLYQTEDGRTRLEVRFEAETAWLTQAQMAELFQTTIPNVSMHIRNIFAERELPSGSVVKEFLTTAADGKNYATKLYNLASSGGARLISTTYLLRRFCGDGRSSARYSRLVGSLL